MAPSDRQPKVSVYTTSKNAEIYTEESLRSILAQTYRDLEVVIVDGASTDRTVEIISRIAGEDPRVRWVSEPDDDAIEGFYKAIGLCRGEYIFCLPMSDFYLSRNWIEKCVQVLDADASVSLVHGCPVTMIEDGTLVGVPFIDWLKRPLPSKEGFTAFYFGTCSYVSEITYGVRRYALLDCLPPLPRGGSFDFEMPGRSKLTNEYPDPFLYFLLNFFTKGYLATYLPILATAGRSHERSRNNRFSKYIRLMAKDYTDEIVKVRNQILSGKMPYFFRGGNGEILRELKGAELKHFKWAVLKYRISEKHAFDHQDSIVVKASHFFIQLMRGLNMPLYSLSRRVRGLILRFSSSP